MRYLSSDVLKKNPELYEGITESTSWVMKENNIFNLLDGLDRRAKILDIGCGNGAFLEAARKMGFSNLQGADIANYLKDKTFPHQVIDLNTEKLNQADESLDIITAFQVLEHLENYFLILHEAERVLKKGGLFIFSIPNQFNIFYRAKFLLTGNISGFDKANNHLLFLTRDVFNKTFLKNFELAGKFFRRGPVPMLGRLNIIPGVKLPAKVKLMPRREWCSDRVCCILKKK